MVPIALAMYVVMGEKKFISWVHSKEIEIKTTFTNLQEVKVYLAKAGYDFKMEHGLYKTHYSFEKEDFFIWDIREGKVCAIFSIYDDKEKMQRFISSFERVLGKQCFLKNTITANTANTAKLPLKKQVLQTRFVDRELLIKTLKSIHLKYETNGSTIRCYANNYALLFENNSGKNYECKIIGNIDDKIVYQTYKNIDLNYGEAVQKDVIMNVKKKINNNYSMKFEQEETLEDGSVVITISV